MPLQVQLVNMPFADACMPSIALTQLKAVVERAHGERVRVRIAYLNHEFARRLGPKIYDFIATSQEAHVTGLGEWLFRTLAFPELGDNTSAYITRYRYQFNHATQQLLESRLGQFRKTLQEFLDELIERHQLHEADVVGSTSMFSQNLPTVALFRRLRSISDRQIIIMGGANCEGTMGIELATNVPHVDFVFSGPSLVSFPEFIGHVLHGRTEECHRIDGVFSRRNARSAASLVKDVADTAWQSFTPERQLSGVAPLGKDQDINDTPRLDYDGFLQSLAHLLPELVTNAHIPFETSRGCWWGERAHCTFCGLNGGTMAYRAMHPQRALAFLNDLLARYGDRFTHFDSVDNILPREYFSDLFPLLRTPERVCFFYEVKADLTDDQVGVLSKARVRRIQPGIEALATSTLKLMRKGTTAFHGVRLLESCRKHGITPNWNLLVGFPGETSETYDNYIKLLPSLFHLPPPAGVFPVRFDRFSPYFLREREYGLRLAPYDYYDLCYPFSPVVLRNMAYYFQDTNYEAQYARDLAASMAELQKLTSDWNACWASPLRAPRLEIRNEPGGAFVDDTRSRQPRRYAMGPKEFALLELTKQPTREDDLSADLRQALPDVLDKGLLFRERGRIMSLVCT